MEGKTKRFIFAALFYMAVGAVVGLLQAINPSWVNTLRFSHAHLLLLGSGAMMVYGIGYFILPRFASANLLWPGLVSIHFWLANTGLIGMVLFKPLGVALMSPMFTGLFYAATVIQVLGMFMFCINLAATLATAPPLAVHEPAAMVRTQPAAASLLTPDSPVADWVDGKEGARELLVAAGLRPLADSEHMELARKAGVTLSHACMKHGMPLDDLVAQLFALPDKRWRLSPAQITPDTIIGAMVDAYPETGPVLERRFGSGCFTCPGFPTETLTQGAMMHGIDVHDLVAELKAATGEQDQGRSVE